MTTPTKSPQPGWDVSGRPTRRLAAAILTGCALIALASFIWTGFLSPPQHADFYGLWSFAKFLHTQTPATRIYNPATLQAFQSTTSPAFTGFYPCPYPPSFLALTYWLGYLPIGPAKAVWTLSGLALLTFATARLITPPHRLPALSAILVAPASILNAVVGETAFFTTAFLLLGLSYLPTAPIAAGIAFALLLLKPQLAILIPIILIARRAYTALASTALATLALTAISCLVLPPALWPAWAAALPQYQSLVVTNQQQLIHLMSNLQPALECLHIPSKTAFTLQQVFTLSSAPLIYQAFRNPKTYTQSLPLLLITIPLAAPHAFIYDTPFLAIFLTLTLKQSAQTKTRLGTPIIAVFLTLYLLPLAITSTAATPVIYAIPEALALLWAARATASLR